MTGLGKSGKGLGKGCINRNCKVFRDNIQGIKKPSIRSVSRRCILSGLIYEDTRGVLKVVLKNVNREAVT